MEEYPQHLKEPLSRLISGIVFNCPYLSISSIKIIHYTNIIIIIIIIRNEGPICRVVIAAVGLRAGRAAGPSVCPIYNGSPTHHNRSTFVISK